jgi:Family of unknown function (DUF6247)
MDGGQRKEEGHLAFNPSCRYFLAASIGEAMSSSHAEKITHPAELWLPARLERAAEVFASLDARSQAQFISEFLQALYEARRTDNLRPLQDVIEAWYRTLVARRSPDYEAAIAWAREHEPSPDDLMDAQQLRERMGI